MALFTRVRWVVCTLALLVSDATAAQQVSAQHARVELISRQNSVTPGNDLELGVHFVLEPGWHIYWINPGDSGQPPSFKWQLPSGFSAGEIEWPRPERMQPSKALVDYGYHDDVLLPLTLHVPPVFDSHTTTEIAVEAKWLVCREICIPEHAQLRLALPVAAQGAQTPSSAQLFGATEKLLPRHFPHDWKASATSAKDEFVLAISAGRPITKATFFPLEPGQIDNAAPQKLESSRMGARIRLKKSDMLLQPIGVLRGILVIAGGPAYRIEAPVRQPIQ